MVAGLIQIPEHRAKEKCVQAYAYAKVRVGVEVTNLTTCTLNPKPHENVSSVTLILEVIVTRGCLTTFDNLLNGLGVNQNIAKSLRRWRAWTFTAF